MIFQHSEYEYHQSIQIMVCKVYFTKTLFPQESKVSTFFLNLKTGPEVGDPGHGLLLQHQGPKRVCPVPFNTKVSKVNTFFQKLRSGPEDRHTPFLAKEIKVSTFFPKLKSGLNDGDQGHGLLLQLQGPKRVRPTPFLSLIHI